jgi:competence protein ComEA
MKKKSVQVVVVVLMAVFAAVITAAAAQEITKININSATVEELAVLEKIGPTIAARIVEYRKQNGMFGKPEDIMNVKGVGQKTFELNKDRIVVE